MTRAVQDATALSEPQRAASISFFSAPAREERAAAEATEHLATFYMDREEYGVEVQAGAGDPAPHRDHPRARGPPSSSAG